MFSRIYLEKSNFASGVSEMKKNRLIWAAVAAVLILFCIFAIIVERKNQDALQSVSASGVSGHPTILIDAGHGGVDGGTVAKDGTVEKGINLEIALKLETIFRMMGFDTVMTRREDISIHDDSAKTIRQKKISDLHNRLKLINETPDCLFISIHQNSYPYPNNTGTQVFYSPNHPESQALAAAIQQSVIHLIQPQNTRKVKKSGTEIYLLYQAKTPAVMVECGLMSNAQETEKLRTEAYQNELALSIFYGVLSYLNGIGTADATPAAQ